MSGGHILDCICKTHGMQHKADTSAAFVDQRSGRTNEPDRQKNHGQAFHSPDLDRLTAHVLAFVPACNLAQKLKTPR